MAKKNKAKKASELLSLFEKFIDFLEEYAGKIKKMTKEQFHKLKLRYHGKSFAIVGPKAAGKTTFINILRDPNYEVDPMNYTPTQQVKNFNNQVVKYNIPLSKESDYGSLKLKLRKPKDVGGEKSYRDDGDWAEVCKDSDYIFYILDAHEYDKNEDMKKRFKEDLEWIADNNQLYASGFGIILFLNKMDKISPQREERKEWAEKNIPEIESQITDSLESFNDHFLLATPISLQSRINRANAISEALLKTAEL